MTAKKLSADFKPAWMACKSRNTGRGHANLLRQAPRLEQPYANQ